ncbi:MAG: tetratricopeptide repeat protein [Deltaproteobacteria bacterium]|nr:tetratricopeptide repeat protein [Deltaproteobacteria bacterium]
MKPCRLLEAYCDRTLSPFERKAFERHFKDCEACSSVVDAWNAVGKATRSVAAATVEAQPDSTEEARLRIIEQVERRPLIGFGLRPRIAWVATAIVLLVVGLALYQTLDRGVTSAGPVNLNEMVTIEAHRITAQESRPLTIEAQEVFPINVPARERILVRAGADLVGFGPSSSARFTALTPQRTRIVLNRGRAAFSVAPRESPGQFVIDARGYEVRVVGTRFLVELKESNQLVVVVSEGALEVVVNTQPIRVETDQRLTVDPSGQTMNEIGRVERARIATLLSEAPHDVEATVLHLSDRDDSPDADVNDQQIQLENREKRLLDVGRSGKQRRRPARVSKDISTWQQWVLEGRLDEATRALHAYLGENPGDVPAWFLLADCQKRAKNYPGAVTSYRAVITHSSGRAANTARYRAGVILQENLRNHDEAAGMFERFLDETKAGHHLSAEAMLRLADSLHATGRTELANTLLEEIVNRYQASEPAAKALKRLEKK